MASIFNNLVLTAVGDTATRAVGGIMGKLQSSIGNGGRDTKCKFYSDYNKGGSIIQVYAKSVAGGALTLLKNEAVNQFNSWLGGKKNGDEGTQEQELCETSKKKYGKILLKDAGAGLMALDDWGCVSTDALILSVKTDNKIRYTQDYYTYNSYTKSQQRNKIPIESYYLAWYDVTALVNINSDRNIVVTRVQGRDYSRKELVSNGDIKFSVSGQITSKMPDVYPEEEVKKFLKIMQYKGVVSVNNQLLDQFGIENIIITDFSLSSKEGYKSVQQYSFSAIGLQPATEYQITEDTVKFSKPVEVQTEKEDNKWKDMLNDVKSGLKTAASDIFSQGAALATGMAEKSL